MSVEANPRPYLSVLSAQHLHRARLVVVSSAHSKAEARELLEALGIGAEVKVKVEE